MVGRSRYSLPLSPSLAQKFDALSAELDVRVLASAGRRRVDDPRFRLVRPIRPRALDGPGLLRAAAVPRRTRAALVPARRGARAGRAGGRARASSAASSRACATRVIADIHGDPAAPTRLYGSPSRKALAPLADALARYGLRRSDGVRTISAYTSGLVREAGVEPTAEFAAFMDLEPFLESEPAPLPQRPVALFVGVLERYKAVDVLAEAWRRRGSARSRGDAPPRRARDARARCRERSSPSFPAQTRWTRVARRPRRSRARSTRRPCSSSRRARRVSAASSSRRSAADAGSSGAGSAGSRTSSRTAHRPARPAGRRRRARRRARPRALRSHARRAARAPRRASPCEPWLATPEEYAAPACASLVDEVTATWPA